MVALPLRLYVALRAELVSRDGAAFIWYAQNLRSDPVGELRAQKQHPLYPAMVLASHHVLEGLSGVIPGLPADPVKSWVLAAVAVALAGGLAVVVGVYALTCVLFRVHPETLVTHRRDAGATRFLGCTVNGRVGLIAALLAAVTAEFCQLSGDTLTDMPHLAVFLLALAAAIRGVRERSYGWLIVGGLLAGVAYLIRPEGAEVAVVTAVGVLFAARFGSLRRRMVGALLVCLAAGVVASPYMVITGKLVPKKSIKQLFWGQAEHQHEMTDSVAPSGAGRDIVVASVQGFRPPAADIIPGYIPMPLRGKTDLGRAWARIGENWARSLRVTLLLPAGLWLVYRRRRPCEVVGGRLVAGLIVLHVVILTCLIVHFDYLRLFSLRHVMVLAALTLPFSAAGIAIILDIVPAGRERLIMAVLAAGLIGPTLPWMLETRYADGLHIRRAGEWIRRHDVYVPRIMTTLNQAALYADGVQVWCPADLDPAWVLAEARQRRPTWMVFEEIREPQEMQVFFDGLKRMLLPGEGLEREHETAGDGPQARRAVIFRYRAPDP